jgi:hypothetical protein
VGEQTILIRVEDGHFHKIINKKAETINNISQVVTAEQHELAYDSHELC